MTAISGDALPALTADQMREVDRIMVEELGVELLQMMENAGRGLSELALRRFRPSSVVVHVVLARPPEKMSPAARAQLEILRRMGLPIAEEPVPADLVIDALIGYSLRGDPTGRSAELIAWANRREAPVLALDAPSGLDVTSGKAGSPCMQATVTLTLALPKTGLASAPQVGELYLADISVPPLVYRRLGLEVPSLFAAEQVVQIGRPR